MKRLLLLFPVFVGLAVAQEWAPVDTCCGDPCVCVCPMVEVPICDSDGNCIIWEPPCWCDDWWPCSVQDPLPPPPLAPPVVGD